MTTTNDNTIAGRASTRIGTRQVGTIDVPILLEPRRGCGFRQAGGAYLVTEAHALAGCGKMPVPLRRCPTCDSGIKQTKGWTWIKPGGLIDLGECGGSGCGSCPLGTALDPLARAGLLWIGAGYYPTPEDWTREALVMGVSRRLSIRRARAGETLSGLPRGLKLGETWVFVAHRAVVPETCEACHGGGISCECCVGTGQVKTPGIFHAFKPARIEYVVRGDETEEQLGRLLRRSITPVSVVERNDETAQKPLLAEA